VQEHELIERVRAGDMAAARTLYDAHIGAVHRLAMRITGDDALAQEAAQVAFVRAFRAIGTFRGEAAFATWIHKIATSSSLNLVKARKRWWARTADIEDADAHVHTTPETDPDLRTRLYAAIDALPEIYRSVFVLHEVEGHNHDEIGALLGIANGTSKARLSVARSKLRVALKAFEGEWANA
jgi:RNA polymerase sigma-70 factor (ECF subfamily)